MDATDDQIEAARTKVRNMLHAADHGNHLGEVAVMRMAASEELLKAARNIAHVCPIEMLDGRPDDGAVEFRYLIGDLRALFAAISKAEGSTLMERRV